MRRRGARGVGRSGGGGRAGPEGDRGGGGAARGVGQRGSAVGRGTAALGECVGVRCDVLGAQERQRAVRDRRRPAAQDDPRCARRRGSRGVRLPPAGGGAGPTGQRESGDAGGGDGRRLGGSRVSSSDVAGGRSAAAHARPGRQPGEGPDRRWSALDARALYAHAKTAGYLYEAALRTELTRELGVEWTPVRNGIAEIAGVPPAVLRAFSRRRVEIEAAMEQRGVRGARAARVAALDTRRRRTTR